jgi:hypothetical protein
MDNADPNPAHHRLKAGEVRFLLTNNTSASPHASAAGYTGYPAGSVSRYLTPFTACSGGSCNNSWMLGHELGHQHQQPAYQINLSTESTVNIYSYVVERNIQGSGYTRTTAAKWKQAQDTYLSLPVEERVYDMDSETLEALFGANRDELRFMVWEQLLLIFGDDFYKRLHRITREEQVVSGSEQDRRLYLIWKASQITGYDLREFFNRWGIRVTDDACKDTLQARFEGALSSSAVAALPKPVDSLLAVTGQSKPAWTPLPLQGISSSRPSVSFLERDGWTIIASLTGAKDDVVGGDKPEYIIDEDKTTAFCFVKPGKTYGGITVPAGHVPSFTIDMKRRENITCFRYLHRTSNTLEYLRARKVSLYGKNSEAEEFAPIVENVALTVTLDEERIDFPPATYRYVQLRYIEWNTTSGGTIQVAEFDLGPERDTVLSPVAPPAGGADTTATVDPPATPPAGDTATTPSVSFLERGSWTIITSSTGPADGTVGGDKPEYIIDGDKSTAFLFVKPGKTYGGVAVPAGHVPSFTIDMKQRENISYFRYLHRTSGNSQAMLRASNVSLYGKDAEADDFTPIVENVALDVSRDEERIDFPPATYRYVQLRYIGWNTTSGSTIQVAEFDLGPERDTVLSPVDPPATPPAGGADTAATVDPPATPPAGGADTADTVDPPATPPAGGADTAATVDPPATPPAGGDSTSTGIWGSVTTGEAPYILYPNPVKAGSPFYISAEPSGRGAEKSTIRIYDAEGKRIRERVGAATPIADVLYTSGIFFVSVESSLGRKLFKVLVRGR